MRFSLWTMLVAGCAGGNVSPACSSGGDSGLALDWGTSGPGEDGAGACSTWLLTYDLTGSTLYVDSNLKKFNVVLQEPYSSDSNMGPGRIQLRVPDHKGKPALGLTTIVKYEVDMNFVAGGAGTNVVTDVVYTAADPCGVATGTLDGTTLEWSSTKMSDVCQNGQITCSGTFCGSFGAPPSKHPEILDDECGPQNLGTFKFSSDWRSFTMGKVTLSDDKGSHTDLDFKGTMDGDPVLDTNTPACACGG